MSLEGTTDLKKLITDMTDEELKEHLARLRRIHAAGAVTRVRAQTSTASGSTRAISSAVKKLDPAKIVELAKILARKRGQNDGNNSGPIGKSTN